MTEDQFKRLLEENTTRLLKRIDERLEQNNAVHFGQLSHYFDTRFDALHAEFTSQANRIYTVVDGIAKRLDTDEQERAAITVEQERQNGWIRQLAKATNTKLIPEQ